MLKERKSFSHLELKHVKNMLQENVLLIFRGGHIIDIDL
jgi:hypothetical protein